MLISAIALIGRCLPQFPSMALSRAELAPALGSCRAGAVRGAPGPGPPQPHCLSFPFHTPLVLAGTQQPVGAVTAMAAVTPTSPPCTREGPSLSWACVTAAKGRARHPAPHPRHPRCGRALQAQPVLPGAWLLPATRVGAAGSHHPCPSQQGGCHSPSLPRFPLWALWPLSCGVPRRRGAWLSITKAGRDPGFALGSAVLAQCPHPVACAWPR